MYINNVYFQILDENEGKHSVSDARKEFYRDLYLRYKIPFVLSEDFMIYANDYMEEKLFSVIKKERVLDRSSMILFPKQGRIWDDKYVSLELYLKDKYKLNHTILDIKDSGCFCVYQAMKLSITLEDPALIISMESDTLNGKIPFISYFLISKIEDKNSYKVVAMLIKELNSDEMLEKALIEFIKPYSIHLNNLKIFSHADYGYQYHSGFIYFILSQRISKDIQYFLVIDKDPFLNRYAILLLQNGETL